MKRRSFIQTIVALLVIPTAAVANQIKKSESASSIVIEDDCTAPLRLATGRDVQLSYESLKKFADIAAL